MNEALSPNLTVPVGAGSSVHGNSEAPVPRPLPPAAALRIAGESLPAGPARKAVWTAADRVAQGVDPRTALEEVKDVLPTSLHGLLDLPIRAELPAVLNAAAAATADRADERRQLATAVAWPLGVCGATLLVAAAALALLAPGFQTIFEDFGTPLPWLTKSVLAVGGWLRAGWFVALPLAVAALVAGLILITRFAASVWPFSSLLRAGEQARVCELLAALVDAHVPLPEALRAVGWTTPDAYLGRDVALTADAVAAGAAASAAASRRRHLPVQLRTALRRADQPEVFAEALRNAAAALRERVDGRLGPAGLLAAALQPILLLGTGAVVLMFGGALILPLLNLLNDLS